LAERNFRKINKGIAKELEKNVTLNVFHLQMGKKNKRLHETVGVKPDGPLSYKELEDTRKHMKTYRSHRNVAEIEREFMNTVWNINHNNNNSVTTTHYTTYILLHILKPAGVLHRNRIQATYCRNKVKYINKGRDRSHTCSLVRLMRATNTNDTLICGLFYAPSI
jgi:hypothetical protein